MNRALAFAFCFIVFFAEPIQSQDTPMMDSREALRGILAIRVSSAQDGCSGIVDKDLVKQDVEVKLRVAGIRLTPLPLDQLNVAFNCVTIESRGKRVMTAVNLTIFLSQLVWLPPQPIRVILATTWHQQELLVCGAARKCDEEVRSGLSNYVDKFINDFLAMNPKQ